METEFWKCQPESEPWRGPGERFALVDPSDQSPARTEAPILENRRYGAELHNARRTASFRFLPFDHNEALMNMLRSKKISLLGRKWCEGMFHSRSHTRLVFVELKAKNRLRLQQPVKQIRSVLSFLQRHEPGVLNKARWKRAIISNRKHPFAYTAQDRDKRHQEQFHAYKKEFSANWGVRLESGFHIEL